MIQQVGVVGAGQMGQGIAQVLACAGIQVVLVDISADQLELALSRTEMSVAKLKERNKLPVECNPLPFIATSVSMDALANCDLVVEAATEDEMTKRKIFQALNGVCKSSAILASNTSSISIGRLAALVDNPERMLGVHFMNPVPLMALIEVIVTKHTSENTRSTVLELAEKLGKTAVVVKDRPAFVLNRILLPTINEAIRVVEEGTATPEQVDQIMTLGAGFPIGPLALADMIGLDTCLSILDLMFVELKDARYLPAPLLREKVVEGELGKKSGKGFYTY
ncbi:MULTISPECIES: 3-hydroxyacyl-CoA dehydrogenase family protein [unclassified Marinobacterium]|jgi:3-hydroxybutyryl-CoA dehydrogenase|uniref:3-hydroxyacyl-CoA dehydrogenase family protein n=1 Tax=unclassified Marinobacterium TaxID=2644139 RepID=UPI001A073133|nr:MULTISPECIES: 3-hydroxyacyl-CoA dehydrogenase NAD-binding domain-containing protein [unclassified Marinobacterium]NRP14778.1 putative 3-hydroxybutyryl-CoA dehydrogenase [Marinobacterium sp. xm-a-152]NRP27274.1 putative 3-hydroxybutyryl-CoA dehydrogenase [Marinobacterium sp. xm-d-420]NRP52541.1 putative 3-hydroxybutyryl-CoA dehydrogenase [Marinobacterium sp. xm-v-242]NRP58033.1 putative 3-hydroxybutyryl-CoA dehydrogenase [Marinobacterium sp. xm-d-510]NRP59418.1 putative 3-hydroxybutyryl-CoA 